MTSCPVWLPLQLKDATFFMRGWCELLPNVIDINLSKLCRKKLAITVKLFEWITTISVFLNHKIKN